MDIEIDYEVDADYITIQKEKSEVAKTIEVDESIILDFDKNGKLIGVELLNASKNLNSSVLKEVL